MQRLYLKILLIPRAFPDLLMFAGHFHSKHLALFAPIRDPVSTLYYVQNYSNPVHICRLTEGMTELISMAKYSSNDRPHTGREEGTEDQRKVKVKSSYLAPSTMHVKISARQYGRACAKR